ncbi:ATP-binding cassette domain-containing protein [Xenorhabdus innexi]|uniref:Hemolysin B n=2 Tax=Xenorhabdus innexi TaxID=290109 RepID=A0A2G0N5R7_9GAMM|nr:ATP-binding cassette domain-containing protein [Xenorhabdus innexi]PHM30081.1 Hemolysin B [Xenorhabdus innexi]
MSYLAYKSQFESRVISLIDQFISLKMLGIHLDRLSDIVLNETEVKSDVFCSKKEIDSNNIEIKNLSFKYKDNAPYLMENLSFNIRSGDSVVITGPSGCGKSTLLNLMMGNIQPTDGKVIIGDSVVHESHINNIRKHIGYVAQDDILFSGSIIDNITFFDENPDMEKIINCTKISAIHDDIIRMPMKYETLVGDMGTTLSGGQKQRLCLARALYKNPKILFLDEATSHLDVENEKIISSNLKMLNITKVMVAHRKETIESANKIIKL